MKDTWEKSGWFENYGTEEDSWKPAIIQEPN